MVVVQSIIRVWLFATPWTVAHQASLYFTISWSLLKVMSLDSVMPSNHLILCCPFSSHLQPFPASGSFPMSQLFASGGQSIGVSVSASASVLPINIQYWFPFSTDWPVWFLGCPKDSQEYSPIPQFKSINSSVLSLLYGTTLTSIYDYWKNYSFDFVGKVTSLLFNTLSRFVIAFLLRSKHLLISWLQSPSAVILEPKKIKSLTISTVSPSVRHEEMGPDVMILGFLNVEF